MLRKIRIYLLSLLVILIFSGCDFSSEKMSQAPAMNSSKNMIQEIRELLSINVEPPVRIVDTSSSELDHMLCKIKMTNNSKQSYTFDFKVFIAPEIKHLMINTEEVFYSNRPVLLHPGQSYDLTGGLGVLKENSISDKDKRLLESHISNFVYKININGIKYNFQALPEQLK